MKRSQNRTLMLTVVTALVAIPAAALFAQGQSSPPAYSAREDQASWINDTHFHEFYQATIDAFANGPDKVDRAAFEKRSREIFRALAVSRKMEPEHLLNHLARIPGEVVQIVTRDPKTLASYDAFITQLFGPQMRQGGAAAAQ